MNSTSDLDAAQLQARLDELAEQAQGDPELMAAFEQQFGGKPQDPVINFAFVDPEEFLNQEYFKYKTLVAEDDPMDFDDWLRGSDLPDVIKARSILDDDLCQENIASAPASAGRIYRVMRDMFGLSEDVIQERVGKIVVTTSDDPAYRDYLFLMSAGRMAYYSSRQVNDAGGVTVFFRDLIPSGLEARVILREMFQLQARRVDATGRLLLEDYVDTLSTWGAGWGAPKSINNEAVLQTIEVSRGVERKFEEILKNGHLPSSRDETKFVLTVQEVIKQGVTPDVNGIGVSGWLHEVHEHVKHVINHTIGFKIKELDHKALSEICSLGNPFISEVKRMNEFERARIAAEKAEKQRVQELERLKLSDIPEMEVGELGWPVSKVVLGYYESGDPVLVVFECPDEDSPDMVYIRTADSERWDVTGKVVAWVDVPVSPLSKPSVEHAKPIMVSVDNGLTFINAENVQVVVKDQVTSFNAKDVDCDLRIKISKGECVHSVVIAGKAVACIHEETESIVGRIEEAQDSYSHDSLSPGM